ncbi:hypothetical protein ACWD0J_40370, partial [Streptomyces sp. NPDC003011]
MRTVGQKYKSRSSAAVRGGIAVLAAAAIASGCAPVGGPDVPPAPGQQGAKEGLSLDSRLLAELLGQAELRELL